MSDTDALATTIERKSDGTFVKNGKPISAREVLNRLLPPSKRVPIVKTGGPKE